MEKAEQEGKSPLELEVDVGVELDRHGQVGRVSGPQTRHASRVFRILFPFFRFRSHL